MKEYDLFIPLYYNEGTPIESRQFQDLQKRLLTHFGGLTFFPQPSEGFDPADLKDAKVLLDELS